MLETKKSTGMSSEYQSGWIFGLAIMNRAPRADWWSVDRVIPKITVPMVRAVRILWIRRQPSHSATAGENSTSWAIM